MPRVLNGWVPLVDLCLEAGYSSSSQGPMRELVKPLTVIELRPMPGIKGAFMIPEKDAASITALIKEHRAKTTSEAERLARVAHARTVKIGKEAAREGSGESPPAPQPEPSKGEPIAALPIPREQIGFQPPRSLEQEFTDTVRKLVHLCRKLNDDREVVATAEGAEVVKQVKVEKKETISG